MKNFRLLPRLVGLALAGLTSISAWAAPASPVVRSPMTTNDSTGLPVLGDVPTYDDVNHRWTYSAPPGAGGGEANTIVNDGNGVGVYASKVGVALHLNTLTNTDGYVGIVSNASLLTFTFLQKDLYQHTNANLTLWQAIAPSAKQDASANLTLLSGYPPDTWQKTNANLTLWQAISPAAKQDALPTVASNRFLAGLTDGSGTLREVKVTYTNGVTNWWVGDTAFWGGAYYPGGNVTFTTNGTAITIAATGGGGGETAGTIHSVGMDLTVDQMLVRVDGTSGTNIESSTILSASDGSLSGINNLTATNTITGSVGHFQIVQVVTNRVGELEVTNGITLGGVRQTAWPAGTGTNWDLGSFNNLVVSNQLDVLGTMTLSELDVSEIIVTNNVQGSNVIANVAVITPKVQATNGANLVLAVNTTNVATAAGSSGIMNFVLTPTVNGVPVLTNAAGGSFDTNADYSVAGHWTFTGPVTIANGGADTNVTIAADGNIDLIATNGSVRTPSIRTTNGATSLVIGVGTTNAMTIPGATAVVDFLHTPKVDTDYVITESVLLQARKGTLGCSFDGGGSVPSDNTTNYLICPYTGWITGWNIVSDGASPTNQIDVLKIATGTALPSSSICAAALPALTTGNAVRSTAVSTWTTNITAGDILGFKFVHGIVGTKVTVELETWR